MSLQVVYFPSLLLMALGVCNAWFASTAPQRRHLGLFGNHGLTEDDEGEVDWRDFRAKLVIQYRDSNHNDDNGRTATSTTRAINHDDNALSSPSSWAYESGSIIETGSLIVAHPYQDFGYGGLNQQYFHKSIILVIEHNNSTFTKGLILNRPTNLSWFSSSIGNERQRFEQQQAEKEEEDDTQQLRRRRHSCKIWFGGDVEGIDTDMSETKNKKELLCLHSLSSSPLAMELSYPVMKNIHVCERVSTESI